MAQSAFSLSWSAHNSNICSGLSSLQQNGEFVDMTLAADGHHVKVHQIIMALASPYLRDLITSAQCPHPVIFLNKVSYNTLSAILEYIYTGEVQVSFEYLAELIDAGKELHIKGLEDMDLNQSPSAGDNNQKDIFESRNSPNETEILEEYCLFDVTEQNCKEQKYTICIPETQDDTQNGKAVNIEDTLVANTFEEIGLHEAEPLTTKENDNIEDIQIAVNPKLPPTAKLKKTANPDAGIMQYTVSNQGSLQMILNRFLYYLKHSKRDGTRQWRCVDYLGSLKCPAMVFTKDDIVIQRVSVHVHPLHDKKILKKIQDGSVFTAIREAVNEGNIKKSRKAASVKMDKTIAME